MLCSLSGYRRAHTRAQLLLLKAEALDLIEVVASLLWGHVVGGYSGDGLVAGVVGIVEDQGALPWVHLPRNIQMVRARWMLACQP